MCVGIARNVPSSSYKLTHTYGRLQKHFRRYVVCKNVTQSISIQIVLKDVVSIVEVKVAHIRLSAVTGSFE